MIKITDGLGICDKCLMSDEEQYLIPVLNWAMCQDCYNEWNERAIYYPEDIKFETQITNFYLQRAKQVNIEIKGENYGKRE